MLIQPCLSLYPNVTKMDFGIVIGQHTLNYYIDNNYIRYFMIIIIFFFVVPKMNKKILAHTSFSICIIFIVVIVERIFMLLW